MKKFVLFSKTASQQLLSLLILNAKTVKFETKFAIWLANSQI